MNTKLRNRALALTCMLVGVVILIGVIAIGGMGGRSPEVRVESYQIPITPTLSDAQRKAIKQSAEAREIEAKTNALTSHGTIAAEDGWVNDVPTTTYTINGIGFSISMNVPALRVVCLNGVQYWADNDRDMRSESLAPKFSSGNAVPDTCEPE